MPQSTVKSKSEQEKSKFSVNEAHVTSEIRYRRLFESAKEGILILDAETGMIVDVNPFLIELLGYSKEKFVEKTIWEIGFFKDIIDNKDKFLELQQDEYVRYEDLPLKTSDGRKINVEFVSNVYFVNDHKVIQCNIRDITDRKVAEAGLEKTRKELAEIKRIADEESKFTENIINTVREPLLVLDGGLRVIKASGSFYNFFKVNVEDTIGRLIYELGNHQWDIPKLRELLEKILPEKTTFDNYEVEHKFSSIGTRIMLLNARQIIRRLGKEKIILLAFEDITVRKGVERSLSEKSRLTSEYLNILLNHAHAPIIIWDSSLVIKRFNPEFEKLSGYSKSEVQDKKIEMLFPKNEIESTLQSIKNNIQDENSKVIEINILTKDNKIRTVLWNSANIFDKNDNNVVATIAQDITTRKQAEEALSESETKYRTIVTQSPDGIFITDLSGNFLSANKAMCDLLNYSEEELLSMNIWDVVPKKYLPVYEARLTAFIKGESNSAIEYEAKGKDGSTYLIEILSAPFYKEGKIIGIQSFARDITERKQLEKEKNVLASNLNERVKELTCLYSISSIIGSYNISLDEMFNKIVRIIPSGWQYPDITCARIVIGKNEYKTTNFKETKWKQSSHIKIDGTRSGVIEVFYLKAISGIDEDPFLKEEINILNIIASRLGQVVERKNSLKTLKENETAMRNAQEIAKMGSWDYDVVNNKKNKWSENMFSIFGLKPFEIEPTYEYLLSRVHPNDLLLFDKNFENILKDRLPVDFEFRIIFPDGAIRWIQNRIVPIFDDDKLIQLTGINIDITERKLAEEELIKAKEKAEESDRLKTAFLTNMSHEIRTPMNGILGFVELLKEPNLTSDDLQDFVQIIQISGDRMLNTINDIVNISKIESGLIQVNIDEANINKKIEFTYNFFKPEAEIKKLQLSYKNGLQSKESIIKTDKEKVYAILTNLVKNAIKFTKEGSIEFGYELKGEYLEFFVKDTGIGIQQKQKEIIFERFRQSNESDTRSYEGNGLGLSISKFYVKMLGGEIWVESEQGIGSTFYFTIPYNPGSEEKPVIENNISEGENDVQLKKLKILIVEDDEVSHSLLTLMLQNINCEILHAITGIDAVEACRKNPDIDLILMDIRMPGMDGNEATRQIRKFNKEVIIIAQTAFAFPDDKEKAIEAGCNSFITKPINKTQLTELIKNYFN